MEWDLQRRRCLRRSRRQARSDRTRRRDGSHIAANLITWELREHDFVTVIVLVTWCGLPTSQIQVIPSTGTTHFELVEGGACVYLHPHKDVFERWWWDRVASRLRGPSLAPQ